ncbi:MAG: aminoacetone oxidase family FAD-binding enzyme [Bacteroidales bacterium]|nr:aminoacetone oxidase family FAD-binding enzyme [Bacteroidales bacterium]
MKEVIVIGAGPAGMLAAGTAAERGARVGLLEKMEKPGRKLAITGKGRCNITNLKNWEDFSPHVHPVNRYFKPAFYNFTSEDTVAFFNNIGLPTVLERGTRVYPASQRAFDVIDALKSWLERLGVRIICGCQVLEFLREETKASASASHETNNEIRQQRIKAVRVRSSQGEEKLLTADHFILATGGKTYPGTGSTGDGYALASALGHTIEPLFPTLTALMPVDYDRRLERVELRNVRLDLYIEDVLRRSEEGELLFSNLGIEGPIGFRVSRQAVVALNKGQRVSLHLNLKPALTREQLMLRWERENSLAGSGSGSGSETYLVKRLRAYMPEALTGPFVKYVTVSGLHPVDAMTRWVFPIASYGDWARAVVTAGGISMKEVDMRTMRSKLIENLSFAGEVLDLDADSGGYNLQIAFATGRLAGGKTSD